MSVIEKLEVLERDLRNRTSCESDGYLKGKLSAYRSAIELIKSDPTHTAREKAKRAVEKNSHWLEPRSIVWFDPEFEDDDEDTYPSWVTALGPIIFSFNAHTDLTPTPEEIATGCCCYVVPPTE